MKKYAKKAMYPFVKVSDRIFSKNKIRRFTTKAARIFLSRYTSNGTDIATSNSRVCAGPWDFMLDTPKLEKVNEKKAYISGWFVPHGDQKKRDIRLVYPSGKKLSLRSDIKRFDVSEVLSNRLNKDVPLQCGFGKTIAVEEDGNYKIEFKHEDSWEKLSQFSLRYDPDFIVSDIFNGNLAYNYAAHKNLVSNKRQYFYESESDGSYSSHHDDVKPIAFYLPQFHPFKENDTWWGKGFTEWTNVAAAVPRYIGHEQPKLPADLGYYDLRVEDNIKSQIDLAKKYGIHAFCFYYYWFSGDRLMEKPLDTFLKRTDWDFNFMICWANENWTRRWDGRNQDVLIAQKHKPEDPLKFIKDVEPILLDERYVRVNGKPLLAVYRADDLSDPVKYAKVWREYFQKTHNQDLYLVAVQGFSVQDPKEFGFDRGIEFAPLSVSTRLKKDIPRHNIVDKILDVEFTGAMYDYRPIALTYPDKKSINNAFRSVMPRWDNDARRKGNGGVFANANPDLYGYWLSKIVAQANKTTTDSDEKLVFINAWNEWAEGAYLEPDTMYGHAYLRRTAEVLAVHSQNPRNIEEFPLYGIKRSDNTTLAVVLHLFYPDMWPEFKKHLEKLQSVSYDLFVSLPTKSATFAEEIKKFKPNAHVLIAPNRGRDVLPFVHIARRLKGLGYTTFLKLHSKKSKHRKDGNLWIKDMLSKLIPSKDNMQLFMDILSREDTGIIGPHGHYISLDAYFGSNEEKTRELLTAAVGEDLTKKTFKNLRHHGFFAGTMFWGRLDAIESILDRYYQPADFEPEAGQIDGTLAHAAERVFSVAPVLLGRKNYSVDQGLLMTITAETDVQKSNYAYAKNKQEMSHK